MAAVDNSSSHSLSPKVPKFILIARESLVFQLLLSISAPSRSVTDYLGHRIWISSLTTAPSWQSRLQPSRGTGHFLIMQIAPCRSINWHKRLKAMLPAKIQEANNVQLNLAHKCTVNCSERWQRVTDQFPVPLDGWRRLCHDGAVVKLEIQILCPR